MIAADRRFRLGALCLLVFVLALFIKLPAGWLLYWAEDALPARLEWRAVDGAFHNATFDSLTVDLPAGDTLFFDEAEIRTSLLSLFIGRLQVRYRLRGYNGELTGELRFGLTEWKMEKMEGSVSLSLLTSLVPGVADIGMGGRLSLSAEKLQSTYHGNFNAGTLDLLIEDLQLDMLETPRRLGDYVLTLSPDVQGDLNGKVTTGSDEALLTIDGQLRIDPETGQLNLTGHGRAPGDGPPSILALLALMGEVKDNTARFSWRLNL